MTASTHTPAPWKRFDTRDYAEIISEPEQCGVAMVARKNDADLISAAPDMLAALQAQHTALDLLLAILITRDPKFMPTQSAAWPALVQGNAAIAKATGATP